MPQKVMVMAQCHHAIWSHCSIQTVVAQCHPGWSGDVFIL